MRAFEVGDREILGAPGLDSETWERSRLHPHGMQSRVSHPCEARLESTNQRTAKTGNAKIRTQTVTTAPNREAIERSFRRKIYALGFGSLLFSILLLLAVSHELISITTLRVSLFVYVGVATAAYLFLMLNARKKLRTSATDFSKPPDAEEQKRLRRSIRLLKRGVVFYALALILGIWMERDELSFATVVGVAISLLIQTWLILTIRRANRRLRTGARLEQTPE
jgi:uncharacterized integral membrane protein